MDAAIWAVVTLVITAVVWGIIGSFQGMAMWLLIPFSPVLPFLIFGTPVAVMIYGLFRQRTGVVIGPILLTVICVAGASYYSRASDRAVHAFVTQSIEPASRPHDVLMTDGGAIHCDIACIRILASASYSLARASSVTKGWRLYRRGTGEACVADAQQQSTTEFRQAGFPDMCAIQTNVPDIANGLLVRERHLARNKSADAGLPSAFGGSIYEIIERVNGKDRILGRRLDGYMRLPVPQAVALFSSGLISEKHINLGPRIDPQEFLANAVGTSPGQPFRP